MQDGNHKQTPPVPDAFVRTLAEHGIVRKYPKGAVIITEGDPSDSIYVILSGRVKVYLSDDGREVVLNVCGPGTYLGELAFDAAPRSASVMTLEPCTFSVLTGKQFRDFVIASPDAAIHLIHDLIHRVRTLSDKIRNFALLDVYGRVAHLLVDLAEDKEGQLVIDQPLTQQELAQRVGCSREMISRIFKDLVAGGYIKVEAKRISIQQTLPKRW